MNPLQAIRKRRRRLVSQVLGGLAVVWLGMVLQPCLMAAEMAMDGHCPHCPAPTAESCDGAVSNGCKYNDRVDYDGRSAYSKLAKKTLDHSPVLFAALAPKQLRCSRPVKPPLSSVAPAAEEGGTVGYTMAGREDPRCFVTDDDGSHDEGHRMPRRSIGNSPTVPVTSVIMASRFARTFAVFTAMGLLYAGPVAACICVDEPMPAMPCCPDDPQDSDQTTHASPDLTSYSACTLVPADLLPSGPQDLPSPVAISGTAALEWSPRAPPAVWVPRPQEPHESPPIYLVTLRLRN
jgi:hypothetical protein